jgi:hypothetical protein
MKLTRSCLLYAPREKDIDEHSTLAYNKQEQAHLSIRREGSSTQEEIAMRSSFERRASPRFAVQCPIKFSYLPPVPNPPDTSVIDLSLQGAKIQVPDPLILGSIVPFQIITFDQQVIDAHARVVHVNPRADGFFRTGVQFTELSVDARVRVARELEHAQDGISNSEATNDSYTQPLQKHPAHT